MDTYFSRDNIRIWRDSKNNSLNFMFMEDEKNCVKQPHIFSKQDVLNFMMPYIYELAYFEAYGEPYIVQEYQKAINFKDSLEDWLNSCIAYGIMTLTEASLVLSELYLPNEKFSPI